MTLTVAIKTREGAFLARYSERGLCGLEFPNADGPGGAVPDPVDLAVIATPAPTVPGIIAECAAAGVRGAVVLLLAAAFVGPDQILVGRMDGSLGLYTVSTGKGTRVETTGLK